MALYMQLLSQRLSRVCGNYARLRFSSYTTPFLNNGDIELIASVLDQQMKLQEIDGEFVDVTDNPYLYAFSTDLHTVTEYIPDIKKPIWLSSALS